jgi:hypothetical protein
MLPVQAGKAGIAATATLRKAFSSPVDVIALKALPIARICKPSGQLGNLTVYGLWATGLSCTEYVISRQRPPGPLQLKLTDRLDLDGFLYLRQHSWADEDFARFCLIAKPRLRVFAQLAWPVRSSAHGAPCCLVSMRQSQDHLAPIAVPGEQ